jgi:hypothetical protein
MFIPDPESGFSSISDPGVKKAPDPGYATLFATLLKTVGYWGNYGYLDETNEELCVEHEDGLVLPGRLAVEVHAVQHVLHHRVRHYCHQDRVLKSEHQLNRQIVN